MASDMIEGELNVSTMSNDQIVNLISPTHLPAEEKFDASSLFVVVRNILNNIVDDVLPVGQEHLEKLEEKVSTASFNPLLCTLLKQVSYEMAGRAPYAGFSHKTTMSIHNKLSDYSWEAKAVLTLAAFALDYEDRLELHSSHQLVGIIHKTLNSMESIFELKRLSTNKDINDEPAYVYWIIITIVACIPYIASMESIFGFHLTT